jgi:hypothetical protein
LSLRAIVAAACLLGAAGAQAQIYKCVDARGVTHYSDKQRSECEGVQVDIRGQEPISGKLEDSSKGLEAAERDFQQRRSAQVRAEQEQARAEAARQRRCAGMKAEYQRFISLRRPGSLDADGNRVAMDAAERDARTAKMEADIARECS